MIDPKYKAQVDLLLQTIPYIAKEEIYALKGGTAINLFVRSMPRLSVDIDLTYLPIDDRETALKSISEGLSRIKTDLERSIPGISVTAASREGQDVKIKRLTDDIKDGFLVALISHMRPISEVISPMFIDQRQAFETQFSGMANIPFRYDDYERTRIQLVGQVQSKLTNSDRKFLMSFKEGNPDWEKLSIKNASELPAVQWKLQNIERLILDNPKKHKEMVSILESVLFG